MFLFVLRNEIPLNIIDDIISCHTILALNEIELFLIFYLYQRFLLQLCGDGA